MRLQTLVALWAGKLAAAASHRLGRGGSNLPGRLARAIDPGVLRALAAQPRRGNLVVTGTNGKTTTAKMLAGICAAAGVDLTHNRAGANLIEGLTAAFINGATWTGRVRGAAGVLEVDEATMPAAVPALAPRVAVITNFFRDQLDRYGELETTVRLVRQGLAAAPGLTVALNADDPLCAGLVAGAPAIAGAPATVGGDAPAGAAAAAPEPPPLAAASEGAPSLQPLFYGVEDPAVAAGHSAWAADVRHCVRCGHPYEYDGIMYAHLGHYRCSRCGHRRPQPAVYARAIHRLDAHGSHFTLVTPAGEREVHLQVPGLYNIYNALAAAAAALAFGLPLDAMATGLTRTETAFGRMERLDIGGREVFVALVKNPVGYNEVLRTVVTGGAGATHLLLALNDLYADGTDVSWIWDVDFEMLVQAEPVHLAVCSGLRAEDLAVRLKYAGLPAAQVTVQRDLKKALDQALALVRPGERLYILPTYTAMLQMRRVLSRLGHTRPFWEV